MFKKYYFNPLLWTFLFALAPLQGMETDLESKKNNESTRIVIVRGDITKQIGLDAIVNAANDRLHHGGGVAASISGASGEKLQKHCNDMPNWPDTTVKVPTGQAVTTPAFNLTDTIGIHTIIHTVGPNLRLPKFRSVPSEEDIKNLRDAYTNSLKVAVQNNVRCIGFPSISTKIFAYDINLATPVAINAIMQFIQENPTALDEVRFILFVEEDYAIFKKEMDQATNQVKIQKPIESNQGIAYYFLPKSLQAGTDKIKKSMDM